MTTKQLILILFLAGVVAYGNTVRNGLFWDDDEFISKNAYIRSFKYIPQWLTQPLTAGAGVNSNYYRPLLTASFSLDYHLWGLWPVGYHLENILWHTAAGILLFFFLSSFISVVSSAVERPLDSSARRELLARNDGGTGNIIAFTASLLWLVHPVHVEAVAYANSRGDSMATFFVLLTLILWIQKRFWASAATFVLALMSKEFAIVTPGLILLVESLRGPRVQQRGTWQSHNKYDNLQNSQDDIDDKRSLLIYITNLASKKLYRLLTIVVNLYNFTKPIFLHITIAVIYLILRLTVLNFQNTLNFYGIDLSRANSSDPLVLYATSLPVRLMTFFKVLPIYGSVLIWPNDLHMERTVDIATTLLDPAIISVVGLLVLIGLLGYWLLVKHKQHLLIFALGWFFVSILPVSGIIPISQILAEHFLYLPSIGLFLLVSWVIISLIQKRIPLLIVFCSLLILLLLKTIRQNRVWQNPITFYEYTLSKTTPTARVYNNLAMAYAETKEHQKAINNYQLAINMGDVYPNPHYNLGNTLIEMGKTEEAEKEYKRALEIDPSFHYATLKLGQIYLDRGKINDAKNLVCPVFPTQPLCR